MGSSRWIGEPEEVHPGNEDGVRWIEEGEGQKRLDFMYDPLLLYHFPQRNTDSVDLKEATA